MRHAFLAWLALALCPVAGGQKRPGSIAPVHFELRKRPQATVRVGEVIRVAVTASIAPGWHLYALAEPENGPMPTQFSVGESAAAELLSVSADKPFRAPGARAGIGSGEDTTFYAGHAVFGLSLRMAAQAPHGPVVLHLMVRYQACNDHMCLPPRSETLGLPVVIVGSSTNR